MSHAALATIEDYRARLRASGGHIRSGTEFPGDHPCRAGVVSVITVGYNCAKTIGRTIDSVVAQEDVHSEYIVIDGGSTDGTVSILRERSAQIQFWLSEPDGGISDAFNKGVALASGEYVAIINSDDWLECGHLRTAIAELETTNADFVFGDLALYTADGRRVHFFKGDRDYARRISHYMPFLNHPSVVCRRSAFERNGLFDTSLRTAMDYDWFLRFHKLGGVGHYSPRLLANMTLDGQSDRNFMSALREVRDISIRHGYPAAPAWARFVFRSAKGKTRRAIAGWLPGGVYEKLRRRINANYLSSRS
jgi:glycosyltransferase involved in cell wall biosynthesis